MNNTHPHYKDFITGKAQAKHLYETIKTHSYNDLLEDYELLVNNSQTLNDEYYCKGFYNYIEELENYLYDEAYAIQAELDSPNSIDFESSVEKQLETLMNQKGKQHE